MPGFQIMTTSCTTNSSVGMMLPTCSLRSAEASEHPQVFTSATPPYVITHANPRWTQLCGWTLEEVCNHR